MRLVSRTRLLPAFVAVGLALPATAAAQSTGGTSAPEPQPAPQAQPASEVALIASPRAYLGRHATLTGTVPRRAHGRVLRVQRFDEAAKRWRSEARTIVGRTGRFSVRWSPTVLGQQRIRATLQRRRSASVTNASLEVSVRVYEPGVATWYGPGLYGNTTACGQELTKELVGIAHKTLPCGTMVEVTYRGRSLVVPVVDRGPYAKGMTWDLTSAAAEQLGFTETARIGALVQPAPAP
ncbi:MAG TPA: septal ring lytic transglycosylase RlpA family protein [Solirubrobacteraceae bacterium]|nr:septal ring lytic transglycosylase RlpA family protein [Solirubrobacteraceae bacterium]